MKERLQKIIAAAGICSRRAAEELLRHGRVRVNGQPAALGDQADPESDTVTVDGQPAAAEGLVCARPVTPYPPGVPDAEQAPGLCHHPV